MADEIPKEEFVLNDIQKKTVLKLWEADPDLPPGLTQLVRAVFPELKDADGRCKEGRAVKAYLATLNVRARGAHEYKPKEKPELSDEDKHYIAQNLNMSPVDLTRVIFKNDKLGPLNIETRTVTAHIKAAHPNSNAKQVADIPEEDYKPPNSFILMFHKVNRNLNGQLDKEKLTPSQRKGIETLINYMNSFRLIHQINSYISQVDRDLFESTFIRCCWDKFDLSQEEQDQFVVYATEVVIGSNIQRVIARMQTQVEDSDGKISMTMVEAITSARNEWNSCVTRQNKLLESLKGKRSERIDKKVKDNASILNLVELWKYEETRKELQAIVNKGRDKLKEELEKLTTMDDIKLKILGVSSDEIMDG